MGFLLGAAREYDARMWSVADIADAVEAGLVGEAERLDAEHAVSGLDALEEVDLHPLLAAALTRAGYGVHREQRYPAHRKRSKRSEGERCDFVLTPNGRALGAPDQAPTLFDPPDAVALEDAFWLEVKVVAQFTREGPNHNYTSQFLAPAQKDIRKLFKDPHTHHGGLLIVLFSQDERVAEHDLAAWLSRGLAHDLPVGSPSLREFAITDRLGNALCALALYPIAHA